MLRWKRSERKVLAGKTYNQLPRAGNSRETKVPFNVRLHVGSSRKNRRQPEVTLPSSEHPALKQLMED